MHCCFFSVENLLWLVALFWLGIKKKSTYDMSLDGHDYRAQIRSDDNTPDRQSIAEIALSLTEDQWRSSRKEFTSNWSRTLAEYDPPQSLKITS